ncbi:MAG: hypothetical protein GY765_23100 [bacterium]|nr:hypothetical protein [bacterium]
MAHLKALLKYQHVKISSKEIAGKLARIKTGHEIFPSINELALVIRLLAGFERSKRKEYILLEDLDEKKIPATIVLGTAAEDWPGMSNAILGIVHHRERNVTFMKGFTVNCQDKKVAILITCFQIASIAEYDDFNRERKSMVNKLWEAAQGSSGKYLFLEDEAVKFEIYNDILRRFMEHYSSLFLVQVIEESGEVHKFITSRSREYLEDRRIKDLAELIINNYIYQNMIRSGVSEEVIRIKNFKTKKGKDYTGITFVCREGTFSIEDFLMTLNHIVPDHIIKHHKSFITVDGILVYRIEIVDRYEKPLNTGITKTIEKSMEKLMSAAHGKKYLKLKAIVGFEHYARAIIPFLVEELKSTKLTQVFLDVARKSEFVIEIKLVIVSAKSRKKRIYNLSAKVCLIPGVSIKSIIPTKMHGKTEINIIKLKVNLSEFSSIKEIYGTLKKNIRKIYGEIRDFDEGFRDIYIKTLSKLLDKLDKISPALIREIFFNIDELYKIEIPFNLMVELIRLCSRSVEKSMEKPGCNVIFKYKSFPDYRKTIVVVSYEKQKRLMSKLIRELCEVELYFTKIEWNQRSYLLMVISKDNDTLEKDYIKALREHTKHFAR